MKKNIVLCPNFEMFRNELEAPTSIMHSPGVEFSIQKKISTFNLNSHTSTFLSIKPRSYPSKNFIQAQEQFLPGGFNFNFSNIDLGFPISIDFSRDSPPVFSTVLPIMEDEESHSSLQLHFRSLLSLSNPLIFCSTSYQTKSLNTGLSFSTRDNFNFCELNFNIAKGKPRNNFIGFSYSINTENQSNKSFIIQTRLPFTLNNRIGLILNNIGDDLAFNFALTNVIHYSDKLHFGTSLQVHPATMLSEFALGFQRGFVQSLVCAKITDKGTIASIFQKKANDRLTVTISSFADVIKSIYSFGFGIDINADIAEFEETEDF